MLLFNIKHLFITVLARAVGNCFHLNATGALPSLVAAVDGLPDARGKGVLCNGLNASAGLSEGLAGGLAPGLTSGCALVVGAALKVPRAECLGSGGGHSRGCDRAMGCSAARPRPGRMSARGFIPVSTAISVALKVETEVEIAENISELSETGVICRFKGLWPNLPLLHSWISKEWQPLISGKVLIFPWLRGFLWLNLTMLRIETLFYVIIFFVGRINFC